MNRRYFFKLSGMGAAGIAVCGLPEPLADRIFVFEPQYSPLAEFCKKDQAVKYDWIEDELFDGVELTRVF
jgi:hypothetical protein